MRRRMRLRTTALPKAFFTLMPKRLGRPEPGNDPEADPDPETCLWAGSVPGSATGFPAEKRRAANTVCERKKTAN